MAKNKLPVPVSSLHTLELEAKFQRVAEDLATFENQTPSYFGIDFGTHYKGITEIWDSDQQKYIEIPEWFATVISSGDLSFKNPMPDTEYVQAMEATQAKLQPPDDPTEEVNQPIGPIPPIGPIKGE